MERDPVQRPRRLRRDGIRELVAETHLQSHDLIAPVFIDATIETPTPISSLPGQDRLPLDVVGRRVGDLADAGVGGVILFGVPEEKDEIGTRAWADDGVIQRAIRRIHEATSTTVIADLCFCEYTSHGHCGVLEPDAREAPELTVDNDATLENLQKTAVSQAVAGADLIAPSGMIDGQVAAIRSALDAEGFEHVPILSYSAKYASSFYGPFRDAADGAPAFGDRRHYQMDPANAREAVREAALDVEEGADILMVKPALAYLDIVRELDTQFDQPLAAYNVSGEYAMIHAAAERGWVDRDALVYETLTSIKRAGADLIITYFAEDVARSL